MTTQKGAAWLLTGAQLLIISQCSRLHGDILTEPRRRVAKTRREVRKHEVGDVDDVDAALWHLARPVVRARWMLRGFAARLAVHHEGVALRSRLHPGQKEILYCCELQVQHESIRP